MHDMTAAGPWRDGPLFHQQAEPVYHAPLPAHQAFVKQAAQMAQVRYHPAHPHPGSSGPEAGRGDNLCRWLACEQGSQAEGISQGGLDALLDSYLPAGASVGWHLHRDTEEYYYLLQGQLWVEWQGEGVARQGAWMAAGDCHRLGPGMWHWAQAGTEGARFIAVVLRCREVSA